MEHHRYTQPTTEQEPDNWKGLTDPKERRRRQNRINQRAFRKRKQAQRTDLPARSDLHQASSFSSSSSFSTPTPDDKQALTQHPTHHANACPGAEILGPILQQFSSAAFQSYILGFPTADHLLTLSKINVFRAFATNMTILGMTPDMEWMHDDAISPFNTLQPGVVDDSHLPVALRPTSLQQKVQHHPWLDFFPHPKMRDNLVLAADGFDDEQLCLDIMGYWDTSTGDCGLLVWGEPSDPDNWEVTEQFLRKYPWIVRGCHSLIEATNRWRAKRGENLIFRYL